MTHKLALVLKLVRVAVCFIQSAHVSTPLSTTLSEETWIGKTLQKYIMPQLLHCDPL